MNALTMRYGKNRERIEWVDIAKGIGIISVIIGHTVGLNSILRNIVFSFHMPLFFVLSGFTSKRIDSRSDLLRKTRKNFITLIVPVFIIKIIQIFFLFINTQSYNLDTFYTVTKNILKQFIYCSGVPVHDLPALGMSWFLISLFSAKLIIDSVHILFKNDKNEVVLIILGIFGFLLELRGYRLPLNLDVTLVAIFFITLGMLIRRYSAFVKKYLPLLFIASALFWLNYVSQGYYIDMSARYFGVPEAMNSFHIVIPILTSLSGILLVCEFSKILCKTNYLRRVLVLSGVYSILIFIVHSVDSNFEVLWHSEIIYLSCVYRVLFDLALVLGFIWMRSEIKYLKRQST